MITKENVCACIVIYNPNTDRLKENLSAVYNQVNEVYLLNNGSINIDDVKKLLENFSNVVLVDLKENLGIAKALNAGFELAETKSYSWVLTLDQDSVAYPELVAQYLNYIELDDVGQLTCVIQDRNTEAVSMLNEDYSIVDWCITSAAFVKLVAWKAVKGFDEKLFIDGVDYDFSLSLNEMGFKTYKINYCGLLHEIGKISRIIKIFGKNHPIYNHNASRRYYICRNNIYLARKHKSLSLFKAFFNNVARIFFVFIFEKGKIAKLKAGIKGLFDGYKI